MNRHTARLTTVISIVLCLTGATQADTSQCGNGVLDGEETCDACATDCTIRPCSASGPAFPVQVAFTAPAETSPSSITVRVAYRSDVLSLPGKGADATVRERITGLPSEGFTAVNDLGYALRVVNTRATAISSGPLFKVSFDPCQGAAAPTLTDFACVVEGCGSSTGVILGCSCSIAAP